MHIQRSDVKANPIGIEIDSHMPMIWYMVASLINYKYDAFSDEPKAYPWSTVRDYSPYQDYWEHWSKHSPLVISYILMHCWKSAMKGEYENG
jgi:hypothetical protein